MPTEVRIYRQGLWWRVTGLVLAFVSACGGFLLMYWSVFTDIGSIPGWHTAPWFVLTVGLLGVALALFCTAVTTIKAIYDSDAVEIRGVIPFPWWMGRSRTGRMLRSDIGAKKRIGFFFLPPTYVLYPRARNKWTLTIWIPKEDDYFRNWIAGIPDADRQFFRNRRMSNRPSI
jgi:hypothetical protein